MFYNCSSLISAMQILPAQDIKAYAYNNMFYNCFNLKTAPEIKGTRAGEYSCQNMFTNCYNLINVQQTFYTEAVNYNAFYHMFYACSSLIIAPKLPAIYISKYSYYQMFSNCRSLEIPPELPATTLATSCYSGLFNECINLKTAPVLPATSLIQSCYSKMFSSCISLNEINVSFNEWNDENNATLNWVYNVSPTGTFICSDNLDTSLIDYSHIPSGWTVVNDELTKPLTLVAETAGSTVSLISKGEPTTSGLIYRLSDTDEWSEYTLSSTITLTNKNDYVQFANTADKLSISTTSYVKFIMSGRIQAKGNIQSMLSYDPDNNTFISTVKPYCYLNLFSACKALTTAPKLPAKTVYTYSYYYMFGDCTNLALAPELPATTIGANCYQNMLRGTAITETPKLPALKLAGSCYLNMFRGCTRLKTIKELPATTLAGSCYRSMFYGCTSLENVPELPATTLISYCYGTMFNSCTSLKSAPKLSATTLAANCYNGMFTNCTSLNKLNVSFTEWNDSATTNWVKNVSAAGVFYCDGTLSQEFGESRIPTGWTVLTVQEITPVSSFVINNNEIFAGTYTIVDPATIVTVTDSVWNGPEFVQPVTGETYRYLMQYDADYGWWILHQTYDGGGKIFTEAEDPFAADTVWYDYDDYFAAEMKMKTDITIEIISYV